MDVTTFQTHVAYSAGLARSARTQTSARALIEVLRSARLIEESEGKLVVASAAAPETSEEPTANDISELPKARPALPPADVLTSGDVPQIQIHIQIRCRPEELEDLPDQISGLLEKLRQAR
jgi:hypothetical protein